MILSPEIHAELSASELCANLRIIAADGHKLTAIDRAVLVTAAAELESAYRQLLCDNVSLNEAAQQQAALKERIVELMPKAAWSMGTGWVKVQVMPL